MFVRVYSTSPSRVSVLRAATMSLSSGDSQRSSMSCRALPSAASTFEIVIVTRRPVVSRP